MEIKNYKELVEKVDNMKKKDKMDLSSDQDLTIAIMNLISIEEHFVFTAEKTGKSSYYDLLKEVREMRKVLLQKIIKEYEGEVWCISKHLLAASMRLMEVGTKQLGTDNREEAEDLFKKSFDLYSLFWGINMKIINTDSVKKMNEQSTGNDEQSVDNKNPEKQGFMGKLGALVKKAVDCCIE